MITVPLYLVVGQVVLLGLACIVLASAYRRLGKPIEAPHRHDQDEAAALVGTALPDLGPMIASDGSTARSPRAPGAGEPIVLAYVLPGCETCQAALGRLRAIRPADGSGPEVHVISVGPDSSIDAYRRFGLPVWHSANNLADIFGLKAYPVFLAVDEKGMIRSSGSAHDSDALRSYLAIGSAEAATSRPPHGITITSKP